jgi:ABC-2 type transport system ATP-binding protein/lipopolysaccharide transport system ATP-binding protein
MMKRINLENVGKRYNLIGPKDRTFKSSILETFRNKKNRKKDFWALRDMNFAVNSGETLGIIGPNGAGKSTLLGLIAGTIFPTEGKIETNGTISSLLELGAGFHPDLSGRENIYLNGSILGLSKKEIDRRFKDIVSFAELEAFIDMPVKHYSSGMYVRLGFAVAVEINPDILLVDEVLAVGDEMFRRKCIKKIEEFQKAQKTMLVVSHDLETIKNISNRILLLDEGKIIDLGDPSNIVDEYLRRGLYRKGEVVTKEWGNREIEIEKVVLCGNDGVERQRYISPEPLCVKIFFDAKQKIENAAFGFSIVDGEGRLCHGSNTLIENYKVGALQGKGVMTLQFSPLTLFQGKYYLSIAIHSTDHKTHYHRKDNWYVFWVEPDRQAEGFLNMPCTWRIEL